ncbi:hypothetical protein GCM10009527_072540 [Actinomadura nitritigenes]
MRCHGRGSARVMDAAEVTLDVENAPQPGDLVLPHEPAGVVPFAHGSGRYLPQPADVS